MIINAIKKISSDFNYNNEDYNSHKLSETR